MLAKDFEEKNFITGRDWLSKRQAGKMLEVFRKYVPSWLPRLELRGEATATAKKNPGKMIVDQRRTLSCDRAWRPIERIANGCKT